MIVDFSTHALVSKVWMNEKEWRKSLILSTEIIIIPTKTWECKWIITFELIECRVTLFKADENHSFSCFSPWKNTRTRGFSLLKQLCGENDRENTNGFLGKNTAFMKFFSDLQQIKFRFHICGLKITAAQQYLWLQELCKAQVNTVCDGAPQSQEH